MRKPEIKPLVPFISRRVQIMLPLLLRHRVPLLVAALVPPDVVRLGQKVQRNVHGRDRNEVLVTPRVPRSVVLAVHVGGDDARGLDGHVVHGRRHSPEAYRVRVLGVPADLDGVR